MAVKLLINGKAGEGKTELLKSLTDAFVISRDGKRFPFNMAHMIVGPYTSIDALINGIDIKVADTVVHSEGIVEKLQKYKEKFDKYPETVVFDSVSKLYLDIIEYAVTNIPQEWGKQGAYVNKEIGILNNFIEDQLIAAGMNVVLTNHVMEDEDSGFIPSVGMGKFSNKGGFYSEVDNSILINKMRVYHRGTKYQSRTVLSDLPDYQYVMDTVHPNKSRKLKEGEEYYNLQEHINKLEKLHSQNKKWEF